MRRLAYLAVAIFFPTPFSLAADTSHITTFTLDNGMEAVVIEDHRAPVVTHMLWYKAGAADEPPGKSGIAHFLEHLMFKGTETTEPGEFSRIVSENGGQDNAFTSFDYTGYFQRISADRLELVMSLEADRMQNLVLTEAEVAPERKVILEERAQRTDNDPGALFSEQRQAALYMNHPYGVPIIGWRHEMETLTLEDALDWYNTYYAPNNVILIVAGDVEPEAVQALAEKHYGPIPASETLPERTRTRRAAPQGGTPVDLSRCACASALRDPHLPRTGTECRRPGGRGGTRDAVRTPWRQRDHVVPREHAPA